MSVTVPTSDTAINVLLVEDDLRLAALTREYLQQQGMVVAVEHRGDRACEHILSERPDLVVLDLMLPGLDGLEVCRAVRPQYGGPILMLTARDEDIDQVVGLEVGADDYVTKPVQPRLLLARIRALLRRMPRQSRAESGREEIRFGRFRISAALRDAWLGDEALALTTNEFELLWLLASHAGEVLSRDTILDRLRGIGYDGLDRSVDIRVSRLRRKLRDDRQRPFRIKTIRGKGYLFVKEVWE